MNTTYWVLVCVASCLAGVYGGYRLTKYLAFRALSKAMGAMMSGLPGGLLDLNRKGRTRGFTAVELLIVLFVLSLLTLLGGVIVYLIFHH